MVRGLYGMWARQRQVVSVSSKRGRCVEQRMQLVNFIENFRVEMSVLGWYSMCGDTEESVLLFTFAVMLRGWRLHNNEVGAGARQPPCLPSTYHSSVTTSNLQRTWHSASLRPTQCAECQSPALGRPFLGIWRLCSQAHDDVPAACMYASFQTTVASSKRLSLA